MPSSNPSSLVSVIWNVVILPTSGSISAWGETSLSPKGELPAPGPLSQLQPISPASSLVLLEFRKPRLVGHSALQ